MALVVCHIYIHLSCALYIRYSRFTEGTSFQMLTYSDTIIQVSVMTHPELETAVL